MLNFFLLYKYTITNFEKSSIVPVIFRCDGGDQFSGLDTRKIVRAKSFTRAIYSTQVVLLTKRTGTCDATSQLSSPVSQSRHGDSNSSGGSAIVMHHHMQRIITANIFSLSHS